MRLAGKTALVTGGARGIGLAFVEAYMREGARVVIADVGGAQEAAAKLGDKAMGVTMDVTDQASIDAGVKAAADWGGGIDIGCPHERVVHLKEPALPVDQRDPERHQRYQAADMRRCARANCRAGRRLFIEG